MFKRLTVGQRVLILIALIIGLGLRLLLATALYGNYDQKSYEIVADIVRSGGNVYAETSRYNYTPVWSLILGLLSWINDFIDVPFHVIVRGFMIGVDLVNALLIALIAEKARPTTGITCFVIYLVNPAAILLIGYGGQFEALATLPLLAAVWQMQRREKAGWAVWALGTAALVIKHITVFSVWMLFIYAFKPRRAVVLFALSLVVFAITFLPYLPSGADGIYENVFRYTSYAGVYGFGRLLPTGAAAILMLSVMAVLPLISMRYLKHDLLRSMTFAAVGLLVFIYGLGDQYFILPLIWGLTQISEHRWLSIYSPLVAFSVFPLSWSETVLHLFYNAAWVVCLFWFLSYFVRARKLLLKRRAPEQLSG